MRIDTNLIFAVLGPAFLLLGVWRWVGTGQVGPQARTWLLIGAIFSAVALWLAWNTSR
jgi:hypothetical protein